MTENLWRRFYFPSDGLIRSAYWSGNVIVDGYCWLVVNMWRSSYLFLLH